jgi:hypothetical protein
VADLDATTVHSGRRTPYTVYVVHIGDATTA